MPARVEPVKVIMSMPGCTDMASPTEGPSPLTRLNTPAGTPASCRISATRMAFSGAISEGLSTMVQPAARAGATLHMIWLMGQFQGVIMPTTPTGSCTMPVVPRTLSNSNSLSTCRVCFRCPAPTVAWAARDSHSGAPISSEMVCATSSMRRM